MKKLAIRTRDQPAERRLEGENSNLARVTIDDDVYKEFTEEMTAVNAGAEDIHAASAAVA